MRLVRFIHRRLPYMPGEVAGFQDREADNLVRRGIAVPFDVQTAAKMTVSPADKMVRGSPNKGATKTKAA